MASAPLSVEPCPLPTTTLPLRLLGQLSAAVVVAPAPRPVSSSPLSETMVTTRAMSSTTTTAMPMIMVRVDVLGEEPEPPPDAAAAGLGASRLAIASSAQDRPGGEPASAGGFGTSPDSVGLFHQRCGPPGPDLAGSAAEAAGSASPLPEPEPKRTVSSTETSGSELSGARYRTAADDGSCSGATADGVAGE